MQNVLTLVRSFGIARLAAMATVTLTLIGFFAFIILRATAPQMVPLFTDLTLTDSATIVKQLDQKAVPYELRNDGTTVLVPKEMIPKLRMNLAEQGLPTGGGVGYEIFDKSDAFSTTSFVQNVNHLRAMEGELARSIRSLGRVASARVHLVIPERPLFAREVQEPSASIVLQLQGALDNGQIRAIRHLVASAVQGLKPERISIVDNTGRLLADGASGENVEGGFDERLVSFERRVRDQVQSILERVVGDGRSRVEVRAELDYSKLTQTSDSFDPESKVARSVQTREERSRTNENNGTVSVGNELPNATADKSQAKEEASKTEEVTNYEISRTTKTEVVEAGRVKRVSVAVLVDGVYQRGPNGDVTYVPRSDDELSRIAALVRSAIGFDPNRGDQVEVVNLRFADANAPVAGSSGEAGMFDFSKNDLMYFAELAVLGLLSLLVLIFAVRPLVGRILENERVRGLVDQITDQRVPALPAPEMTTPELPPPPPPEEPRQTAGDVIKLAQISGEIQAQSIQQVGELVERNPNETIAIIRQWLQEPA